MLVRGKILGHAWERRGWCTSVRPVPTTSEAENVLPVGMLTQSTHIYHICACVHGWTQIRQAHRALTWTQTKPTASPSSPLWLSRMDICEWQNIHTHTCKQMGSPLPRKMLERNLARRQDRLCWFGTGHDETSILTSKLFMWTGSLYPVISLIFPHLLLPRSPKASLVPPLNHSKPCAILKCFSPWHPPVCPMPQGNNSPQSWQGPGIDPSWWVSRLDTGWGSPGTARGGPDRVFPPLSLQLGFPPAFAPGLLWAPREGLALLGLTAPAMFSHLTRCYFYSLSNAS